MKKAIYLSVVIILGALSLNAQDIEFFNDNNDCGHWVIDAVQTTDWQTQDTIRFIPNGDTLWVESTWRVDNANTAYLVYCPRGCGWATEKHQERICGRGIRQTRREITTYKYIPKLETEYDKKIRQVREGK
jgi:hypothetical protein